MTYSTFKETVCKFADKPDEVEFSKDTFVLNYYEELLSGRCVQKDMRLYVEEDGKMEVAEQWIANRLGKLSILADRITSQIQSEPHFIHPSGTYLGDLETTGDDTPVEIQDVLSCIQSHLAKTPVGFTSVLYLTSNAGEGKTTIIEELAKIQAGQFLARKEQYLVVPIRLGGRPFMRLDEVILGSLSGRLRFRYLYYDAFIALVQMGFIVPAFDGFEEMLVESSAGDAVSALGTLLSDMQSSGRIIVAARKAFFEFVSLRTQAKLFDSIHGDASFTKISVHRWTPVQFKKYVTFRLGQERADEVYAKVSSIVGPDHPILTQPVLVKRLVKIAEDDSHIDKLLHRLLESSHDFFFEFVRALLARESDEKWIGRSEPPTPLLSVDQHTVLLSMIAHEMLVNSTNALRAEVIVLVADLFCESLNLSPSVAVQVKGRVCQHAFLTHGEFGAGLYSFDHEEFQHFFLGEFLGRSIQSHSTADFFSVVRRGLMPQFAVEAAIRFLSRRQVPADAAAAFVIQSVASELQPNYSKENAGALIAGITHNEVFHEFVIAGISFPAGTLSSRKFSGLVIEQCVLGGFSMCNAAWTNVLLNDCDIERIELPRSTSDPDSPKLSSIVWRDCTVRELYLTDTQENIFDPEHVNRFLQWHGVKIEEDSGAAVPEPSGDLPDADQQLKVTTKLMRIMIRKPAISEGMIRQRLGTLAPYFFENVAPDLQDVGVITIEEQATGKRQYYYRLDMPMRQIQNAIDGSGGVFGRFLELCKSSPSG